MKELLERKNSQEPVWLDLGLGNSVARMILWEVGYQCTREPGLFGRRDEVGGHPRHQKQEKLNEDNGASLV